MRHRSNVVGFDRVGDCFVTVFLVELVFVLFVVVSVGGVAGRVDVGLQRVDMVGERKVVVSKIVLVCLNVVDRFFELDAVGLVVTDGVDVPFDFSSEFVDFVLVLWPVL